LRALDQFGRPSRGSGPSRGVTNDLPLRRQGGDGGDICLDPAHVAVAASDMAWAVSKGFDSHLTNAFPELVASVEALAEQLGAKADISTVEALVLILAAAPSAEAENAALQANGCSASSTDPETVCEPPASRRPTGSWPAAAR